MDLLINSQISIIRILLADEQSEFRAGLRTLLESEHDVQIVGEASDTASIIELTCQLEPDILLLDSALFERLQAQGPDATTASSAGIRALVMLASPDRVPIVEAFRLGARGVVVKGSAPRVWFKSIRTVVAGEYWLGSESAAIIVHTLRELLSETSGATPPNNYGLTRRELEIVKRIASGRSNKEVGLEFSICERTVKHHLTNIFSKLGVSSRLKLALFARDNRIPYGTTRPASESPQNSE
jgi:two-component system, NarL family, nitrate/nitrite response regulator NarL